MMRVIVRSFALRLVSLPNVYIKKIEEDILLFDFEFFMTH